MTDTELNAIGVPTTKKGTSMRVPYRMPTVMKTSRQLLDESESVIKGLELIREGVTATELDEWFSLMRNRKMVRDRLAKLVAEEDEQERKNVISADLVERARKAISNQSL